MSDATFKSIFQGKESKVESSINVDEGLLSKLEEYKIITNLQRRKIKDKPEHERPGELTKELRMADNDLVSKFLDALRENGQQHVVRILVPEGTATVPLSTRTVLETAADNSVIIPLIVTVTAVVIVYFILRRRGSRGSDRSAMKSSTIQPDRLCQTFGNIFEGKQSVFEERINVDPVLLSKLQQYGIITNTQRTAIESTREYEKPRELVKQLRMADDKLLPKFFDALTENNQQYLADMLRKPGGSLR